MIGMKKGMFGKRPSYGNASMPQDMAMQETAQMGVGGAQTGDRPGLGTRLLGKGWEDKAMALGGALMGNQFAIPQYLRQQGEMQQQAAMQAERQRQQAMQMAAAQGMGIDPQQAALLGPEGLRQATLQRMQPPEAPKIGVFEDNAGNRFRYDMATGMPIDEKPVFVDRSERFLNQNGAILRVPNPFAGGQQSGGQGAPDRLPADFDFGDDRPQRPNAATAPAPRVTGARRINQQEYQRQLRQFGGDQTSMNAWMRANNVLVGN